MKIQTTIIIILFGICNLKGQGNFILRISGEAHKPWIWIDNNNSRRDYIVKSYSGYQFNNWFSSGLEFGYGRIKIEHLSSALKKPIKEHVANEFYYSMRCNFHLLPVIKINSPKWLDIYISGKYGYLHRIFSEEFQQFRPSDMIPDFGVYLGLQVDIIPQLTIYSEAGYGSINSIQVGLSVKL